MNKKDKDDFEFDEPKKCIVEGCKNKPRYKNKLTKDVYEWVCFKHYKEFR